MASHLTTTEEKTTISTSTIAYIRLYSQKINKPSISIYLTYSSVQEIAEQLFLTNFSLPIDFPGHLV